MGPPELCAQPVQQFHRSAHQLLGSQGGRSHPTMVTPYGKGVRKGKGKGIDGKAEGKGKGTKKQDSVVKVEGHGANPDCGKWCHRSTDCLVGGGGRRPQEDQGQRQGHKLGQGKARMLLNGLGENLPAQQTAAAGSLGLCSLGIFYNGPRRRQEGGE